MNIFQTNLSMVNKFLDNFKEPFSNKQFSIFKMFIYAVLSDYKRLNLSSLSKNLPVNYQQFQYFFSDSKWNYEDLNNTRINILKRAKTTGFSKDGVLAWSLVYWIKQNACLLKTLSDNPSSFNEYKQALFKLILFSSYTCLSKNSLLYEDYFSSIKSKRFRQHCLFQ